MIRNSRGQERQEDGGVDRQGLGDDEEEDEEEDSKAPGATMLEHHHQNMDVGSQPSGVAIKGTRKARIDEIVAYVDDVDEVEAATPTLTPKAPANSAVFNREHIAHARFLPVGQRRVRNPQAQGGPP